MTDQQAAECAWASRMSDPAAAWAFAEFTPTEQPVQQSAQALVLRAYLNWREGRYPEALEDVDAAEPSLREAGQLVWLARAVNVKGAVLMSIGQAPQALALFQEQLALAQQAGDAEMAALAHNDIGVQLIWDDPERARLRYQMAFDVAHEAGPGLEATLGLAAFNISVAEQDLGHTERSQIMLDVAEEQVIAAHAWPYWVGVVSQQALRLAAAGEVSAARTRLTAALARSLPLESCRFLTFHLAKLEAQHGDPASALAHLDELAAWDTTRVDMLDDVLQVRASAQARLGEFQAAYLTLLDMVAAVKTRHTEELSTQLKVVETVHRTEETRRNMELLRRTMHALEARQDDLKTVSVTDELTGLKNRRYFEQWCGEKVASGSPLTLAFIDIDHFKHINDSFGHTAGDQVLRELAALFLRYTEPGDLLARLGGDEFVVGRLQQNPDSLAATLEQIRVACEAQWAASPLRVTVSAGVTSVRGALSDGLRQADLSMYTAKRAGRNRVSVFDPAVDGY
ncbi:diguanylate cyclase [Deinococcus sp. Arct2-2]|uniref:GGDEF domain-containing protein n=1 Tax=Deinococcus sp. Arct2-2 TaxID=2568653 RepID=UPI0010A3C28F|nr:sensor domain-containing diguanylate cyclase [Deinococcus sp. Arct2-2]THF71648.1 diguanylate cyclase [Deinococcus sp. Arct2-2]